MKYISKFNIKTFKFWDGAAVVIDDIRREDYSLLIDAQRLIEKRFEGETPTEIQINDYVWHELDSDLPWNKIIARRFN